MNDQNINWHYLFKVLRSDRRVAPLGGGAARLPVTVLENPPRLLNVTRKELHDDDLARRARLLLLIQLEGCVLGCT